MQIEQKGGDRTLEQKSKQALQFPNKSRSPHTSTLFSENLKKTLHGDLSIRRELSPRMDKQRKMRTPQSREPYTKIGEQLRKAFSGTSSLFRKPNHELNLDRSSKTTVQDVMKIGDVIYFKYSTQVLFQGDNKLGMTTIRWPGYLVGDGLSSERLYCMHQRRVSDFSISKFLFKVELAKKSFVNKRYDDPFRNGMGEAQAGGDHYTELQRKKEADREYEESKKECKGLPITYGQNIILRHIQSNTFLALNTEELARQIGSVQVCLKKEINHLSNMTILPSSRVREMGDFVRYSDTIYMANAFKSHYYVHASGFLTPHEVGLEINGSEMKTEWKPHLFRAHSQIGEGGPNTPLVCPGDIINIQSKHFGGFLSIKATSQEELLKLSQRQAPKKKEKRKNKRGHHSTNLDNMQELFDDEQHLQQIELANKINPDNIKRIRKMVTSGGDSDSKMHRIGMPYEIHNQDLGYSYSLKLEICDKPSLYGYWEIENLEMFNSEIVGYDQTVRIKNIATKQYLARDPKSSTRLIVSQDANSPYCLFTFRTKIPVSKNGYLSCQDLVRIEDCNGNYVQIQKSENFQEVPQPWEFSDQQIGAGVSKPKNQEIDENQDNPYYLLAGEKNDSAFVNFELVKCERDRVEVSKKLSSLLPDFVSFLVFLQGWGIKESPTSSPVQMDSWKSVELDFEHACEKEKDLEIEKDSLEENLKNLLQFLQESSSESSQVNSTNQTFGVKSMLKESNILQYKDKQDYILQQHILEVLMKILEYIFFICFETLKTLKSELDFEDEKGALQAHSLMKFEMIINTPDSKLEKLPQMVARRQLDLVMKTIIKIVLLCCRNSEKSSLFLTNYKQFFLKLLFIYPQDVPDLMEEIASNLGGFGSINQPLLRHDDRFLSQQEGDTVQEYGGQRGGFDSRQTQQRRESQNLNYQGEHQQQQQQQQVQKPGNTSKFGNRDTKYSYTYRRKQDINQLWKNKNAGTYNIQGGDEGPHQDAEGEAEEDFQPEQIEIVDPDSKEDTDFHVTWTSQLRDVNASEGNIGNQIFLFDMLSALMYNKKTGVSSKKYQELIYNELFGKEPNSNNGGYLKFAVQSKSNLPDDGPILVIFCTRNTESIKHFKENNTVLVNHKGDVDGKVNEIYINLDELSKKSELDEVRIYLHYISSFIRMMAIMCRSRFDKAIKKCTEKGDSSIGLSMSFCLLAFQKVGIDTSIKVALLEFYNAVFIDKHPLKPLSQYTNRCFSFDTISKRLITQKAILWLNEEITKQMDHSVWLDQYNVREINIFVSTIIKKAFCDPNIQALTKPEIDISVKLDLLKFQSKVLELIYSFIDFGYAQTSMVISCINLCTLVLTTEFYNDFAMCIEMKDYPAQIALHVFYREARKSIELYGAHRQVILNALKILRLVGKYRTLLQLQVMLQYFKQFKSNEDKICEELPKVFSMYPISVNQTKERVVAEAKYGEHQEEQWDTIVIDLFFKVQNIQPDPDSQEREEAQENESSSKLDGSSQFNKIRSQIDKVSQFNFSIDNILINTLFKLQKNTFRFEGSRVESIKQSMLTCDASDLNRKVEKELIGILVDYYNQRHTVLKELMKVELVKGPKEIELFKSLVNISLSNEDLENDNFDDFHGHDADSYLAEEDSEEGDNRGDQYIFSIQDLGDKVDKLLDLDKNPVESTQYLAIKDKIQKNLIQIIRKLNKMLKKMYSTKINYMKLQNLMRNLNYHKIFIKLFSLKGKDSKTVKILMLLIQFFELYTNSNPANQEVLQGFQNKFVDLTAREFGSDQSRKWYLDPSQIIKNLTSCIADQSEQSQLIDYIFSKINEIIEKGNMLIVFDLKNMGKSDLSQLKSIKIYLRKLICYKKILSGLIFNNKLEKRHQNQRLIISNLINSKKLVKLYEYKYFSEIKNLKVKDLDLIEFYNSFITLLAELSWDFKLGIKQCKRLITMEQLVEILTSRSTPYLLKKHFLKCFHHIIIDDGLTSSLKKKQRLIQDVLDLVISKDLQCFTQYLQGGEADGLPQDANLPNIHSRGHFRSRKNQGLQEDELILRKPSEFWHYVLSDQTIEEREYGLIYFTYSFISKCIKSREEGGFGVDYYEFSESFTKIRETLVNMMDRVRRREQDKSDFDANGTCYMVNQCLEIIPEIKKRNSKYPLQKLDKQFMQDNNSENGYSQQVYRYGYEQEEEDMINDEGTGDDESSDDENLRKKTNSRSLIPPIKHFLIKNRISYEKFIDLIIFKNTDDHVKLLGTILNTDEEIVLENVNQVLKLEFSGFKNLPQSEITIRHLTRALINFERQLMTYELKGKEQKLKMNMQGILDFLAGGRLIKQPENSSDSLKSEYFLFLQFYMNRALEDSKYDKELNPWVQKIRNFINRKEERHRKEYFNIFLGLLLKSGESYFLLRTLKQMLTQEMEESKNNIKENSSRAVGYINTEYRRKFTKVQNFYADCEVPLLCLSMINSSSKANLVDESSQVINYMLKHGNQTVQQYILNTFQSKIYTKSIFLYLKDIFRSMALELKSEIDDPLKNKPIIELNENMLILKFTENNSFKQITNIIDMLKLLCDGCYKNFQDYLRTQKSGSKDTYNPYSVNVINEVSEFLVLFLHENRESLEDAEKGEEVSNMINTCLDLLSEASIGPCLENQALLIRNRRLLDSINEILRLDIFNFQKMAVRQDIKNTVNKVQVEVFAEAINVSHAFFMIKILDIFLTFLVY